ncbi:unnamed protein product (mitochondrion) [Plasmodiophora brassicae]|uniref:Replication protein A subunit n=1 Tax=Plasmodiophora brassicae TaxID=37360 RepID=A0A3P3Y998_PLABS|nr:unnamed protein product [Plasmodiophora brassicae]
MAQQQHRLSQGAVAALSQNRPYPDAVLQVLEVRMNPQAKVAVSVSDGEQHMRGIVATQIANQVNLQMNDIIMVKKSTCLTLDVNGKSVPCLTLLDIAVLPPSGPRTRIGNPVELGSAGSAPSTFGMQPSYGAPASGYGSSSGYGGAQYPGDVKPSSYVGSSYASGAPGAPGYAAYGAAPQQSYASAYGGNQPGSYASASAPGYNAPSSTGYQGYASAHKASNLPVTPTRSSSLVSIRELNPYISRWQIKARVTSKSEMRTWSNAKGEGKLFSFDVLDAGGGEIRVTAFKQDADRFFDLIQVGNVYLISHGQVKPANRSFTHLKHEYEVTLGRESQIEQAPDEDGSISQMHYEFVPINSLESYPANSFVDIIGVVTDVQPASTIVSKTTQREMTKRSVTLVDTSNASVELTLWGNAATTNDETVLGGNPIVAIKGCKVSDFGGRSLGTVGSSTLTIRPDIPEAHQLQQWFTSSGGAHSAVSVSKRGGSGSMAGLEYKTCGQIAELPNTPEPAFFLLHAAITTLTFNTERPPWYLACPTPDCKKKVTDNGSGSYYCEKCNKQYPAANPRYIFSFAVADSTGSTWLSVFHDEALQLLGGRSAEDLRSCLEVGDTGTPEAAFRSANFTEHVFKVRAKYEVMNENTKLRATVVAIAPIDHATECSRVCDLLRAY